MSFSIETTFDQAMSDLWALRNANKQALREMQPKPTTQAGKMVQSMTAAFAEQWELDAPRLTGTLASATRETLDRQGVGMVFIDPVVTNPASGSKPSEYGPIVHRRNPWVARLFTRGGLGSVMKRMTQVFAEAIGDLYEK